MKKIFWKYISLALLFVSPIVFAGAVPDLPNPGPVTKESINDADQVPATPINMYIFALGIVAFALIYYFGKVRAKKALN